MNEKLTNILEKMQQLESDFHQELKSYEAKFQEIYLFNVDSLRDNIDSIAKLDKLPEDQRRFIFLRHLLSAPFIYLMIIPLVFLDLAVTVFQHVCFRLYGIVRVSRGRHFIIDRQLLDQLSWLNKFNCVYCGYGNGVISYAREIVSRTEQYWCPVKHARETPAASERYNQFLEYGETESYKEKRESYREDLRSAEEKEKQKKESQQ